MFSRGRAYQTVNDSQRHRKTREELTHQFHSSLKSLQQKEHVDGATIVSNEASNRLCSVLEAVFLHGVKDNMMSKLVSYAHGTSTEIKLNFWSVVKKFTHKDVIVQLKELSQINSDIGLCRAWVRLAINDGLVASYLASMMADTKTMRTFYHSWAYMLDYEQPDILRNHLTGLMGLNFRLSLNSSVLNTWSSRTIQLAGLSTDGPSLAPVIRAGTPTPPSSRRHSQLSTDSNTSTGAGCTTAAAAATTTAAVDANTLIADTTTATSASVATSVPDNTADGGVTNTPHNTPADPSFFHTAHDMDLLRFVRDFRSASVSSSSSGQASCPDPGDTFHPTGGATTFSARSSHSGSPRGGLSSSPYESLRYMSREDRKMEEETKLRSILQHLDRKEQEREQREKERAEREKAAAAEKEKAERAEKEKKKAEKEKAGKETMAAEKTGAERETGEKEKPKAEKKNEKAAEGEKTATRRPDSRPPSDKTQRQRREDQDSDGGCDGGGGGGGQAKEEEEGEGTTWRKSPVDEGASEEEAGRRSVMLDSCEEGLEEEEDLVDSSRRQGVRDEEEGEEEEWKERESSFGNSLNAMDGWTTTSPYPHHHPHHHPQQQQQQRRRGPEQQTTLDQSYETMLNRYHAQQGHDNGIATVQKILENLPEDNADSHCDRHVETFPADNMPDDDIDFADYEIIPTPEEASDAVKLEQMKSLCKFLGKNAQSNMCANPKCSSGVGFFHGQGRICYFDGRTYCSQCHVLETAYIPAEIIFNWNFKKKKVCAENYAYLQNMQDQPVLDLEEMASCLYSTVPIMNNIMLLRSQLTSLRSYMFTCSESTAQQLKDRVWPREHFYNKVHLYSLTDLLEARSGRLEVFLRETVELCTRHVLSCTLCLAKGFYCELCQEPAPIFPFQTATTVKCKSCKNVYHSRCKTESIPCPKCVRYAQRGIRRQRDDDDDYACSPES
ncbi:uncharacterized protein LOC143301928 isoform X2 [Babylonia areolata]|uniref:uncharacterized protein LOC143301928 isoform X2 n=1 Tax=Babylonia areolata TaxID=304850 RepID=UPI003FD5FD97